MATKFISLESKKGSKKTVFSNLLRGDLKTMNTEHSPQDWNNVMCIGKDEHYGDVFKCWQDSAPNVFTLYFGEKGDEFN